MNFRRRSNRIVTVSGAVMLAIHLCAKAVSLHIPTNHGLDVFRYVFDILIFLLWGASIYWRVVQSHIRRALFAVVGIEVFWLGLRSVKYRFFSDIEVFSRYAWYFYYLPMLMLSAMCLKLAIYLGKNESRSRRVGASFFPAVSSLLFLLVVTNDIHGLVFHIPPGIEGLEAGNYGYGAGYFVVLAYIALCGTAALVMMYRNCRRMRGRFAGICPVVPFVFMGALSVLNSMGIRHIDITFIACFCTAASLEACLQTGMIQTNSGYIHIFRHSSIGLEIVGGDMEPIITSDAYVPVSVEDKRRALDCPVMLENNIRLSESPVNFGHALWQDDLSELASTIQEITYVNEFLQDKNETLQAEYVSTKREHQLREKNRLYNMLFDQSESYIRYYEELVEGLANETDPAAFTGYAIRIAYVSAFIKRRINIIFLDEENKEINCRELTLCIGESLKILSLYGVECSCRSELSEPMTFEVITTLYERFYNLTAGLIDRITSMDVRLYEEEGAAVILICMESGGDLSDIGDVSKVGGEWRMMIR